MKDENKVMKPILTTPELDSTDSIIIKQIKHFPTKFSFLHNSRAYGNMKAVRKTLKNCQRHSNRKKDLPTDFQRDHRA